MTYRERLKKLVPVVLRPDGLTGRLEGRLADETIDAIIAVTLEVVGEDAIECYQFLSEGQCPHYHERDAISNILRAQLREEIGK